MNRDIAQFTLERLQICERAPETLETFEPYILGLESPEEDHFEVSDPVSVPPDHALVASDVSGGSAAAEHEGEGGDAGLEERGEKGEGEARDGEFEGEGGKVEGQTEGEGRRRGEGEGKVASDVEVRYSCVGRLG